MPQQEKHNDNTMSNSERWMYRLQRLPIVKQYKVSTVIAFIGLLLVNKGRAISLERGMKIVKQSKLNLKIEGNSAIPCVNIVQAMIALVIYKRQLLEKFFANQELEVWNDEIAAPLFDIMYEMSEVYRV